MNNLLSSIVTWPWFENESWPDYRESDVLMGFFDLYLKAPEYNLSYLCNREYQAGLGTFWFWSKCELLNIQPFLDLFIPGNHTLKLEVNRRYSTLSPFTDTHYHRTLWKSSFPFLIVFSSPNKELNYTFNPSSNVRSRFGGTLDFSHREMSKMHVGSLFLDIPSYLLQC